VLHNITNCYDRVCNFAVRSDCSYEQLNILVLQAHEMTGRVKNCTEIQQYLKKSNGWKIL